MAYKCRRLNSRAPSRPSSSQPSSARNQTVSGRSSASRSVPPSPPSLPTLPHGRGISTRPPAARVSAVPSSRGEDVQTFDTETEDDIRTREDSDAMNEIIMAVDMKERDTVGCAYYVAREEKLYLMGDIKMADLEIIDLLKL